MDSIPGIITSDGAILKGTLSPEEQQIKGSLSPNQRQVRGVLDRGGVRTISYSDLINKPTINGVELTQGLFGKDLSLMTTLFNTTEGWDADRSIVSEEGVLYVYTDYQQYDDGQGNVYDIAGFKFGDGNAYLIDLPFLTTLYDIHIGNNDIHITPEEREFWNNKNRAYVNGETLVMTKY